MRGNRPASSGKTTLMADLKRYRARSEPDTAPISRTTTHKIYHVTHNVADDKLCLYCCKAQIYRCATIMRSGLPWLSRLRR